ncbi:hypothetical protein B0H14DRAFT_2860834, partial [Mycena olivaceomarginata]
NERDSALRPSTHRRSPLTVLTRRERYVRLLQPRPAVQPGARAALAPTPIAVLARLASPYPTPYAHPLPPSSAALASPTRSPYALHPRAPRTHRTLCRRPCRPRPAEAGADTAPTDAHVQALAECAAAALRHARIAHALAVRATPPPSPDVSSVQSQVQAQVQPEQAL